MNLTKKQVGALLKVLSKDTTRPVLTQAAISLYHDKPYLVATDGYTLAALELNTDLKDIAGKRIERGVIEMWYKLADTKSRFTDDDVRELAKDLDGEYPEWQKLIPKGNEPCQPTSFNANFVLNIQTLSGESGVRAIMSGAGKLIRLEDGTRNIYLIAPMKD